jgi:hypothetical protein
MGDALGLADVLARSGDTSVYSFVTSAGAFGSERGSKSLLYGMKTMVQYEDHTWDRYGTANPANAGNPDYRIDGRYPNGRQALNSLYMVIGDVYYRDPYIKATYMRTGPGTIPYPPLSLIQNGTLDYQGKAGMYPGVLFMFGQTEGRVNPYGRPSAAAADKK